MKTDWVTVNCPKTNSYRMNFTKKIEQLNSNVNPCEFLPKMRGSRIEDN